MVIKLLRQLAGGQDTFSRHLGVALLLRPFKAGSIIDIGGEGRLGIFTRHSRVTTVNIASSCGVDHILNSGILPFENDSFDAAVSIDTLEHIPKSDREQFLNEMLRGSRKGIIACAAGHRATCRIRATAPGIGTHHWSGCCIFTGAYCQRPAPA
jgi:hypothetical protein